MRRPGLHLPSTQETWTNAPANGCRASSKPRPPDLATYRAARPPPSSRSPPPARLAVPRNLQSRRPRALRPHSAPGAGALFTDSRCANRRLALSPRTAAAPPVHGRRGRAAAVLRNLRSRRPRGVSFSLRARGRRSFPREHYQRPAPRPFSGTYVLAGLGRFVLTPRPRPAIRPSTAAAPPASIRVSTPPPLPEHRLPPASGVSSSLRARGRRPVPPEHN